MSICRDIHSPKFISFRGNNSKIVRRTQFKSPRCTTIYLESISVNVGGRTSFYSRVITMRDTEFISFKVIRGNNSKIARKRQSKKTGRHNSWYVVKVSVKLCGSTSVRSRVTCDTKLTSFILIRGNNSIIVRWRQSYYPRVTRTHSGEHFCKVL